MPRAGQSPSIPYNSSPGEWYRAQQGSRVYLRQHSYWIGSRGIGDVECKVDEKRTKT